MILSFKHVSNTCRACETIPNQFLDLKNPHLESKNMQIDQDLPDYPKNHFSRDSNLTTSVVRLLVS